MLQGQEQQQRRRDWAVNGTGAVYFPVIQACSSSTDGHEVGLRDNPDDKHQRAPAKTRCCRTCSPAKQNAYFLHPIASSAESTETEKLGRREQSRIFRVNITTKLKTSFTSTEVKAGNLRRGFELGAIESRHPPLAIRPQGR